MEKLQIENHLDENDWRAFVERHPQGNIFHTPEMFEVFNCTRGYRSSVWAAVGKDREILSILLPVEITLFNGPFRPFTSRAVAYGSTLSTPGARGQAALNQLLHIYNQEVKNRVLFTELRNIADLQDYHAVMNQHGFQFEDHLNFLIDLNRPAQDIWKGIRSSAQRNIRKARKSDVHIEEVDRPEHISDVYSILKTVYKRIQVPLPDISLFQAAFDILAPKGMLKFLLAKHEGTSIGVLTLLLYKDVMYYWYTGTLRDYAAYRAGDLFVWHCLEMGSQNGYRTFDFCGGGRPDEKYGVRDFKAKYGGTMVNYGRNVCVYSPMRYKVSQASYQLLRRLL